MPDSRRRTSARTSPRSPAFPPSDRSAASVRPLDGRRVSCTVVAFDYPAEFSLITGILSSSGVSIVSGDAFTWSAAPEGTPPGLARRRIVDVFVGESESLRDPDAARALEERIVARSRRSRRAPRRPSRGRGGA